MSEIKISGIQQSGECDMWEASIDLPSHYDCIKVIGATLDICISRAIVVRDAFRDLDWDD